MTDDAWVTRVTASPRGCIPSKRSRTNTTMDSNSKLLLSLALSLLLPGCVTTEPDPEGMTSTTSEEGSTTSDASSSGGDDGGGTRGPGDGGSTGEPMGDDSSGSGSMGSTGEPDPPEVDDGAHFRGIVELVDGTTLGFDAVPVTSINPINELYFCTADATIDGHDVDVALSWPDTASLVLGVQPWGPTSTEGLVLRVGIDGPAGEELSLSTAGSVDLVANGNDEPPSVAGVATIDLDPGGDGDLLQSMTEIEFRCLL